MLITWVDHYDLSNTHQLCSNKLFWPNFNESADINFKSLVYFAFIHIAADDYETFLVQGEDQVPLQTSKFSFTNSGTQLHDAP